MAKSTRRSDRRRSKKDEPQPAQPKPWTVMLYMAASKDEQTEAAAIRDLEELEKVGTTKNLNVIVQIDRKWPGYCERYRVWKGGSELCGSFPPADDLNEFFMTGDPVELGEFYTQYTDEKLCKLPGAKDADELRKCFSSRDPDVLHKAFSTGNPIVLREFVRWVRDKFPAKRYLLVMWGHAFGLGFGRDHGDPLTMKELAWALDKTALEVRGAKAVDMVGANACAMSYAEAAYELKDAADFIVAPEIAMPFAGWPYEAILKEIDGGPDISPEKLGRKIIELFIASFKNAFERRNVALTLLNLEKAGDLAPHLKAVTDALRSVIKRNGVGDQIADAFLDTAHGEVRPLIDLFDLCDRLMEMDSNGALGVATAAKDLRTFLDSKDGLIVEPKPEPSAELEGLRGLGIFAPSVTGAAQLTRLELSKTNYQELSLVKEKETGWADLVYDDLKDALEPVNKAVAEIVNGTGAVTREDRMGVSQLLLSVHRSFARLESTLTDSQNRVMGVLSENGGVKPRGAKGEKASRESHEVTERRSVFGPPYLRLANGSGQQSHSSVDGPLTMTRGASNERLLKAVAPLANIEDALARIERTTKKVLTHSRLGLGADPTKTDLGADPTKTDLGADPTKTDLGADPTKTDLGADPTKTDLGLLSVSMLRGFDNGGSRAKVTGLFRQVVFSLQMLEQAVGKLEGVVHLALTGPTNAMNGSKPDEYQRRLEEQVKGSFRELTDVARNARQTVFAVLRHPSQGLGPTPQSGLGAAERQQLAMFGGLSSRNLQLL